MIIENWEKTYLAQAIWSGEPTAEEARKKVAGEMPAYELKTGLEGGLLVAARQVLYTEEKGLACAISVAERLTGKINHGFGIQAIAKVNGHDMSDLLWQFSLSIKNAAKVLRSTKIYFWNRRLAEVRKDLEETLQLR